MISNIQINQNLEEWDIKELQSPSQKIVTKEGKRGGFTVMKSGRCSLTKG